MIIDFVFKKFTVPACKYNFEISMVIFKRANILIYFIKDHCNHSGQNFVSGISPWKSEALTDEIRGNFDVNLFKALNLIVKPGEILPPLYTIEENLM